MPGLWRRRCPCCGAHDLVELRTCAWTAGDANGHCTELRCRRCSAELFRELATAPMTRDAHVAWRNARSLPRMTLRR